MDIFVYAFLFLIVFRVCDYIAAGLDGKIVDPDGGIHEHRLRAQNAVQISVPSVLPANRWTSLLRVNQRMYQSMPLLSTK